MKTPLAWKNLVYNKVRTAVGVAGVGFAVILIFMQLGFRGGVILTATQIYDALDFDLMLRSPAYLHLTEARTFPRYRLYQAASLHEVERVRPFYLGLTEWQAPTEESPGRDLADQDGRAGQWRGIIAMGTEPSDPAFTRDDIREAAYQLTDPRFVAIDTRSTPDYGPKNGVQFSEADLGVQTTLGPELVQIVGLFRLGAGMACNGACIVNPAGYVRACPWQTLDDLNFGLLKLKPGSDLLEAKQQLMQVFGIPQQAAKGEPSVPSSQLTHADVEILTRDEVNEREEYRWVHETPLGQIFTFGVWIALFVGVAIVYQVLSTDIANLMSEYATLKAMGYSPRYLTKVVLQQAVLLALVGYVPSAVIAFGLYRLVESVSGMPMVMTPGIMLFVLVLSVIMCVISGIAALRKLYQADPADLF